MRRDAHMVRRQFEDWLADMADDNDIARSTRLNELFERSEFNRQRDLADAIGVEMRTVQRWLAGGQISKQYWDALADALGSTVRYVIFGEAESDPVDISQLEQISEKLDALIAITTDIDRRLAVIELERELEDQARRKRRLGDDNDARKQRRRGEGREP